MMRTNRALAAAVIASCISATVGAQEKSAPQWTYEELITYQDDDIFRTFVIGIGWGVIWAGISGAANGSPPGYCIPNDNRYSFDGDQIVRMVTSYGDRHPEMRDSPIGILMVSAFVETFPCPF